MIGNLCNSLNPFYWERGDDVADVPFLASNYWEIKAQQQKEYLESIPSIERTKGLDRNKLKSYLELIKIRNYVFRI